MRKLDIFNGMTPTDWHDLQALDVRANKKPGNFAHQ